MEGLNAVLWRLALGFKVLEIINAFCLGVSFTIREAVLLRILKQCGR